MDSEIVVKRLYDVSVVLATYNRLWDEISEDGAEIDDPDVLKEYYLGVYSKNRYIGMCRFYNIGQVLLEGHIFLIDRSNSIECGKEIMKWLLDNLIFEKLVCRIPDCYSNVCKYVEALGFDLNGYNEKSYMKDCKLIGVKEYGISKDDMIGILRWGQ